MSLSLKHQLSKLIVVGDRVLIKPQKPEERTKSGLLLPPGLIDEEKVMKGYVMKTGPGYALPVPVEDESWKPQEDRVKYLPLQAQEGDLAIFLLNGATQIKYADQKYYIVPQAAILLLEREEDL